MAVTEAADDERAVVELASREEAELGERLAGSLSRIGHELQAVRSAATDVASTLYAAGGGP
jgi:hypothetical protein